MITDFGLAKRTNEGPIQTACGTPGYVGEKLLYLDPCEVFTLFNGVNVSLPFNPSLGGGDERFSFSSLESLSGTWVLNFFSKGCLTHIPLFG